MRRRRAALGGNVHAQNRVAGLAGRDEMAHRANPADARHQRRHLVERAVLAEFLKAAQLRDVQARVGYLAVVAQLDGHLGVAFDSCYRVDDNSL